MSKKLVIEIFLKVKIGNSLVVQWLGLCAFTAEGRGSIPGLGTKILASCAAARKKKKSKN